MVAGESFEEMMEQAGVEEPEEEQAPKVPAKAGMNRFVWDMRRPEAHKVEGDTSMAFFLAGPTVLPGRYQVRLSVGDKTWTQPFEIVPDPRGHETPDGERAQYDLLVKINGKLSEANDAVNQIRDVKGQIDAWKKRLKGQAENIAEAAEALKKKLTAVEEELFKTEPDTNLHYTEKLKLSGRMAALKFAVDFTDYAPTKQAQEVYQGLAEKIDRQLQELQTIMQTDLAQLNQQIRDSELPVIAPKPIEAETEKQLAAAATKESQSAQ
jgi:hypothetical protein